MILISGHQVYIIYMAKAPSCSLEKFSSHSCGISDRYPLAKEYLPLKSCNKDITNHLRLVKVNKAFIKGEWHLILLRAGLFNKEGLESMTFCPNHRECFGTHWNFSRQATKCRHPLHGVSKAKPDRGISPDVSKEIKEHWDLLVPVGSGRVQ